jgi:hypothetical protein
VNFIRGISLEHLILSNQADGTFGKEHLVAELKGLTYLTSLDEIRIGFEDREDLLLVRNLLTVDISPSWPISSGRRRSVNGGRSGTVARRRGHRRKATLWLTIFNDPLPW